jgi:uncharacterized membrane protein YfcA
VASYLLPLKLDRRIFVGTTAVFFFLANSSKLPTYYLAGQFSKINPMLTLKLVPFVIAGAIFGAWLVKKLTDQSYFRFVYMAVFGIGWYLVIESGWSLRNLMHG